MNNKLPLNREMILVRMSGIQDEVAELEKLGEINFSDYEKGDGHKLAEYHLHRALEGVFNIGTHVLSRIPGGKVDEYKQIAAKLGEYKIVSRDFAANNLTKMAKYRNRLVHLYAQVTPQETYDIIHNNLGDFDAFLKAVKNLLENPQKLGLDME